MGAPTFRTILFSLTNRFFYRARFIEFLLMSPQIGSASNQYNQYKYEIDGSYLHAAIITDRPKQYMEWYSLVYECAILLYNQPFEQPLLR